MPKRDREYEHAHRAANFAPVPKGDSSDPAYHPRWYGIVRTVVGTDNHYGPRGGDNPFLLVHGPAREVDRRPLAIGSMERAVKLAHEEPVRLGGWGGGTYLAGIPALERLLTDLEAAKGDGVEEYQRLNPVKGDPFRGIHEELQQLRLLSERRRAAAGFLRKAVAHLPAAAQTHADAAAAKYDEVSRLALEAFELRHGPVAEHDQIERMGRDESWRDDPPEWGAFWKRADENLADSAKLKELAGLIARQLDNEKAAVAEIEKALGAVGQASEPEEGF